MSQKIIFLDIDGVLVTDMTLAIRAAQEKTANPACVAALNHLIHESGADIVVSSAWRFCGLSEMRLILHHWGVIGNVIGITPDLASQSIWEGGLYVGACRGNEILKWMADHFTPEGFVILDDMRTVELFPQQGDNRRLYGPHHIHTAFDTGLTPALVADALRVMAS